MTLRYMVSTQQYITHNYPPSPRHGTANSTSKRNWYPMLHTTLTHMQVFFIIIILCAVNVEISGSSDIGLTVNHLTVSNISLTYVTNIGRSDDKRPYLSSYFIEVCPFRNRPCHLSFNVQLHCNFTLKHLNILNGSVGGFPISTHRNLSLPLFRRRPLTSFFSQRLTLQFYL